jgi:hypothetical protein
MARLALCLPGLRRSEDVPNARRLRNGCVSSPYVCLKSYCAAWTPTLPRCRRPSLPCG